MPIAEISLIILMMISIGLHTYSLCKRPRIVTKWQPSQKLPTPSPLCDVPTQRVPTVPLKPLEFETRVKIEAARRVGARTVLQPIPKPECLQTGQHPAARRDPQTDRIRLL